MAASLYKQIGRAIAYGWVDAPDNSLMTKSAGNSLVDMWDNIPPEYKLALLGSLAGGGVGTAYGAMTDDNKDGLNLGRLAGYGLGGAAAGGLGGYGLGALLGRSAPPVEETYIPSNMEDALEHGVGHLPGWQPPEPPSIQTPKSGGAAPAHGFSNQWNVPLTGPQTPRMSVPSYAESYTNPRVAHLLQPDMYRRIGTGISMGMQDVPGTFSHQRSYDVSTPRRPNTASSPLSTPQWLSDLLLAEPPKSWKIKPPQ